MNVRFCKYTPAGQILFIGEIPASMLALQGTDAIAVEDTVEADTHYVNMAGLSVHPMGERPSTKHVFDYLLRTWVDPRTLQNLRDDKWREFKLERDKAEMGRFTYNGMEFDGDLNAQRRLNGCISISKSMLAAGGDYSTWFTLANNSAVELYAQDFVLIEQAKLMAVNDSFVKARLLRAQLDNASTKEEIASISWS